MSASDWDFVPGKHIPVLDGLRGVALAMVLALHACGSLFGLGWIGVDLFFVLSGFLITGILLDSRRDLASLKTFFIRRSLRIFPLYYLALSIAFVVSPYLSFPVTGAEVELTRQIRSEPWYWLYLQNWMFGLRGWPENELLTHLWSLAVEEQFYLIWPPIVIFGGRRVVIGCAILAIPVSIFFRVYGADLFGWQYPYFYTLTICRIDTLMVGAVIAAGVRNWPRTTRAVSMIAAIIGGAILLGILNASHWDCRARNPMMFSFGYTAIAALFGGVLVCSMIPSRWNVIRVICLLPVSRWFGKMSYGIYVFHFPIHLILYWTLRPALNEVVSESAAKIVAAGLAFLVTLIVAKASFELWEKPFLALKNTLASGVTRPFRIPQSCAVAVKHQ